MDSYETLSSFVVPRSSQVLHVEGDNELRSVVLFRRVVDAFINAAREMGCTARDLAESIHPHPTLSETVSFAGEVQLGVATEGKSLSVIATACMEALGLSV